MSHHVCRVKVHLVFSLGKHGQRFLVPCLFKFCVLGYHGEQGKTGQPFHLGGRFNGVIHMFPQKREAYSTEQTYDRSQHDVQLFARTGRLGGNQRRVHDADIARTQACRDTCLLDSSQQAVVELLVRLRLAL